MLITLTEIDSLCGANSERDWNLVCDAIKAVRGGDYPNDWFTVVVVGGIMDAAVCRFELSEAD